MLLVRVIESYTYLDLILGERPDPALVGRLYGRSEGNPLFTEELVAAGTDGRGTVPPSLAAALALRIERLGQAWEMWILTGAAAASM